MVKHIQYTEMVTVIGICTVDWQQLICNWGAVEGGYVSVWNPWSCQIQNEMYSRCWNTWHCPTMMNEMLLHSYWPSFSWVLKTHSSVRWNAFSCNLHVGWLSNLELWIFTSSHNWQYCINRNSNILYSSFSKENIYTVWTTLLV
jgi:hypothetical protein